MTTSLRAGLIAALLLIGGSLTVSNESVATQTTAPSSPVAQIPAGAKVLYVNPVLGNDVADAGQTAALPYRTITYALSQAKPGTVVQLERGSYTEQTGEVFPLKMPQGVILRGNEAEKGQTIAIIGGGNFISRTFARQNMTILAIANSEIRGLTVTNPNTRGTGIWVESGNATIENNTFINNNREGVFVTGTSNPQIKRNNFIRNQGNGISVANLAKGEIEDNLFQDTGFGLAISETAAPLISSNRIIENVDGIYINDAARPVLRNNVIENNRRDGVVATISANPDLGNAEGAGNNVIRNNKKFDLNNSTNGVLYSVGNTLDEKRIAGRIEFVAPPIASGEGTSAFLDVRGHWAQSYIEALAKRNIITGFPGGTFNPDDPVTRVQFAAILNKAFTASSQQAAIAFKDVNTSFWGYQAIQSSVRGGFMRGYPEGDFRPAQRIPRVQVLVALANGLKLSANDTSDLTRYQDAADIPNWALAPVAAATQRKLVVNYPNLTQLNPNREATRAEVAAFVYQALVNAGQAEAIASPYVVSGP